MNAMRLHELPLLGSNQDSPDPESYETGGSAGEIAANAGRTAPEAGNLPHENPHGFQHSPSPVRIPGDATGEHATRVTLDQWQHETGTVRFVPPSIEHGLSLEARRLVLGEAYAQSEAHGVAVVNVYRDRFGTLCFGHAKNSGGCKLDGEHATPVPAGSDAGERGA